MRKPSRHVLLEMLIEHGVEYIFGNPGTTELPLIDGIQDYPLLKYMLALQENVAVAMYSIQGLWTASQYDLPVTYIVCNNPSYRILKHFLANYYFPALGLKNRKSAYTGMNFSEHPLDCAALAEGFGIRGFRVDDPKDLKPILEHALNLGKPSLVDVHIHQGDY